MIPFQRLSIVGLGLTTTAAGLRPIVEAKLKKILGNGATEEQVTKLAKSCLPQHLTKFETVNHESCDCTALFGIITHNCNKNCKDLTSHLDLLSEFKKIRDIVLEARTNVRNKWAHCNLSEWDEDMFFYSFQILIDLVEKAGCDGQITQYLEDLRNNGVNALSGDYVNSQLLKSISEGIEELRLTVARNPEVYPEENRINQILKFVEGNQDKLYKNHKENMEKGHITTQEQIVQNHREIMEEGHRTTQEQNLRTQTLVEDLQVTILENFSELSML
jgi:hypothetical protein